MQRQQERAEQHDDSQVANRSCQLAKTETTTPERDEFPIYGETAHSPQNSQQKRHRDSEFEKRGCDVEKNLEYLLGGNSAIYNEFNKFEDSHRQQDASENEQSKKEWRCNFTVNIVTENFAHETAS